MSILITGATGAIGSKIVASLAQAGVPVTALVRQAGKGDFPANVEEAVGDMADIAFMRKTLAKTRTLFLLNAVVPDELTLALNTLNLVREAGIERIVYLSVIHADLYTDVPHFVSKHAVERMIEDTGLPVTILRPAYFMQNDAQIAEVVKNYGVYPMPVGSAGVAMVDTRDIADVAVAELLRRDQAPQALPASMLDIVGPEALTPQAITTVWSELLGRPISYGGDDLAAFEQQLAGSMPGWMAYDMRVMMAGIQRHGMLPAPDAVPHMERILNRPLRTYRAAIAELLGAA